MSIAKLFFLHFFHHKNKIKTKSRKEKNRNQKTTRQKMRQHHSFFFVVLSICLLIGNSASSTSVTSGVVPSDDVWDGSIIQLTCQDCNKEGVIDCRDYPNHVRCLGIPVSEYHRLEESPMITEHPFKHDHSYLYSCPACPQAAKIYTGGPASADIIFSENVNPDGARQSETECLCIDLYLPKKSIGKSVFTTHGGAFHIGDSSSQDFHDDAVHGVSVAVAQYSLGPVGAVCPVVIGQPQGPCNRNLQDAYNALQWWIKRGSAFGAVTNDPASLTCGTGQSAAGTMCLMLLQYHDVYGNGKLVDVSFNTVIAISIGLIDYQLPSIIDSNQIYGQYVRMGIDCKCYSTCGITTLPAPGAYAVPPCVDTCIKDMARCPIDVILNTFSTSAYAQNISISFTPYIDGKTLIMSNQDFHTHDARKDGPDAKQLLKRPPITYLMNDINVTRTAFIFGLIVTADTKFVDGIPGPVPILFSTDFASQVQFNRTVNYIMQKKTEEARDRVKCCLGFCKPGQVQINTTNCAPILGPSDNYYRVFSQFTGLAMIAAPTLMTADLLARVPGNQVFMCDTTFPANTSLIRASQSHGWDLILWLCTNMQYSLLTPYEQELCEIIRGWRFDLYNGVLGVLPPSPPSPAPRQDVVFGRQPLLKYNGDSGSINHLSASFTPGPRAPPGGCNVRQFPTDVQTPIYACIEGMPDDAAIDQYEFFRLIAQELYPITA